MKKTTQIILFCMMGLICFSFLIYSTIKADEAEKARIVADEQRIEAERLHDEVKRQQALAEAATAEALRQADLAKQALADCQSK